MTMSKAKTVYEKPKDDYQFCKTMICFTKYFPKKIFKTVRHPFSSPTEMKVT